MDKINVNYSVQCHDMTFNFRAKINELNMLLVNIDIPECISSTFSVKIIFIRFFGEPLKFTNNAF